MKTEMSKRSTKNQLMALVLQTVAFFLITLRKLTSGKFPYDAVWKACLTYTTPANKAKYSWIWYKRSGPVVNMWLIKVRPSSSFF